MNKDRGGAHADPAAGRAGQSLVCRVHYQLAHGLLFRVLNVVDVTKECLAAIADTSPSSARVVREIAALIERRGKPCVTVSDDGTEFTSTAVLKFTQERKVGWHFITPGKPT